jgi:hypothetical protein
LSQKSNVNFDFSPSPNTYRVVMVALATTKPESDLEAAVNFQQEFLEQYLQTYQLIKLATASDRSLSNLEDAVTDLENASVTQSDPATTQLGQPAQSHSPAIKLERLSNGQIPSRINQPASKAGPTPVNMTTEPQTTGSPDEQKPRTALGNSKLSRTKTPT